MIAFNNRKMMLTSKRERGERWEEGAGREGGRQKGGERERIS